MAEIERLQKALEPVRNRKLDGTLAEEEIDWEEYEKTQNRNAELCRLVEDYEKSSTENDVIIEKLTVRAHQHLRNRYTLGGGIIQSRNRFGPLLRRQSCQFPVRLAGQGSPASFCGI